MPWITLADADDAKPACAAGAGRAPAKVEVIGVVVDTALRRLAGVTVAALNGPSAGVTTTTDRDGKFSLLGTFDGSTRFRATTAGYLQGTSSFSRH